MIKTTSTTTTTIVKYTHNRQGGDSQRYFHGVCLHDYIYLYLGRWMRRKRESRKTKFHDRDHALLKLFLSIRIFYFSGILFYPEKISSKPEPGDPKSRAPIENCPGGGKLVKLICLRDKARCRRNAPQAKNFLRPRPNFNKFR